MQPAAGCISSESVDSIFKQPRQSVVEPSLRANGSAQSAAPLARNDEESRCVFTPSPRNAPKALINLSPIVGVGNAGCPLYPQPRVRFALEESTRVTTSA